MVGLIVEERSGGTSVLCCHGHLPVDGAIVKCSLLRSTDFWQSSVSVNYKLLGESVLFLHVLCKYSNPGIK